MNSNRKWLEFYRKLGYLFYSVAAADNRITETEISELKTELRDKWLTLEDSLDEFNSDAAYQMEAVFDWLQEETPPAVKAFEKFEAFVDENPGFFTPAIKNGIIETADHIAAAFHDTNKTELSLLFRLRQLFEKNRP